MIYKNLEIDTSLLPNRDDERQAQREMFKSFAGRSFVEPPPVSIGQVDMDQVVTDRIRYGRPIAVSGKWTGQDTIQRAPGFLQRIVPIFDALTKIERERYGSDITMSADVTVASLSSQCLDTLNDPNYTRFFHFDVVNSGIVNRPFKPVRARYFISDVATTVLVAGDTEVPGNPAGVPWFSGIAGTGESVQRFEAMGRHYDSVVPQDKRITFPPGSIVRAPGLHASQVLPPGIDGYGRNRCLLGMSSH